MSDKLDAAQATALDGLDEAAEGLSVDDQATGDRTS